jgi:ribosome biogenesis GTPase
MSSDGVAVVIGVASARCRVFRDGREIDCLVPAEIAARQKSALAVGDRVLLDDASPPRLAEILPRRTLLSRPDPMNPRRERLIAANIDVVANVVSMKAPPLRPRLIDRFLIAIQRGGAEPLIVVNKIDVDHNLEPLRVYEEIGVPVIGCSAKTGEGLDALRAALSGKVSAFVGHSGVGKSSLLNALDERLRIATGELHRRGTGRHTTTSSTLHDLGGGTLIIDTPGIRELGLWDLTPRALRESFPEFEEAAELCRFNDCAHLHEPGCEVKERVESGALSRARYDTYVRLAEDLKCEKR